MLSPGLFGPSILGPWVYISDIYVDRTLASLLQYGKALRMYWPKLSQSSSRILLRGRTPTQQITTDLRPTS